jgi:hypothetical protein
VARSQPIARAKRVGVCKRLQPGLFPVLAA